jgi:hypothetical protein
VLPKLLTTNLAAVDPHGSFTTSLAKWGTHADPYRHVPGWSCAVARRADTHLAVEGDGELVRLAEGREAEVFLRPDGSVLKLMRDPAFEPRVHTEAAVLELLDDQEHLAPRCFGVVTLEGKPGLVEERIVGVDLATLMGRRPWLVWKGAAVLANTHLKVHGRQAPDSLPDLNGELRRQIETAPALPGHLAAFALEILNGLPDGDRLCHGDYHPGNVLGSWAAPTVIDWGNAARGHPAADVARTNVLLRMGDPMPNASRLLKVLASFGQRYFAQRYLSAYCRQTAFQIDLLRQWEVVRAAARFCEGIASEYGTLIAFIESQQRLR